MIHGTLIRCHFSPEHSTGRRYLYSASACGKVFIYDIIRNEQAAILDYGTDEIVRDCLWHPYNNSIFVPDWSGNLVEWYFNAESSEIE